MQLLGLSSRSSRVSLCMLAGVLLGACANSTSPAQCELYSDSSGWNFNVEDSDPMSGLVSLMMSGLDEIADQREAELLGGACAAGIDTVGLFMSVEEDTAALGVQLDDPEVCSKFATAMNDALQLANLAPNYGTSAPSVDCASGNGSCQSICDDRADIANECPSLCEPINGMLFTGCFAEVEVLGFTDGKSDQERLLIDGLNRAITKLVVLEAELEIELDALRNFESSVDTYLAKGDAIQACTTEVDMMLRPAVVRHERLLAEARDVLDVLAPQWGIKE